MEAVILAAGRGARFGSLTSDKPKPLLSVCGRPLLYWSLKSLAKAGISKAYVVVGYQSTLVQQNLGNTPIPVEFIENTEWQKGNLTSLHSAREHVTGDFILIMSDHLFDPSIIKEIKQFKLEKEAVVAVQKKYQQDSGDVKVLVDNGYAKTNGKKSVGNYIDCGLFKCKKAIFNRAKVCIEKNEFELSNVMNASAYCGALQTMDIGDRLFVDVDTFDDLLSYYVTKYEDIIWK